MGQVRHGFCLQVAGGTELQGDAAAGKLLHQAGVLPCPDAVADAGGAQLQGLPDALRAGGLPGVESKRHPQGLGVGKERLVLLGGIEGLGAGQVNGADAFSQEMGGHRNGFPVGGLLPAPHAAENQLAAKGPAPLCRGLGQAGQGGLHHLALGQALAGVLRGGETQLGVEQPLAL